ncbi:MAG: acetate kinase [Alphaproteobacteria bacterium]|nr:acetate kinase [Alphaproteobacteria bacterium]MBN2675367.1 acetate kinase [Alphaproteobacteria bacterium]
MYVLALNCGSSTLKFQVFDTDTHAPVFKGNAEKINEFGSFIKYKSDTNSGKKDIQMNNHSEAMSGIIELLQENGIALSDIAAVGHRVVHGGDKFACSVEATDEVIHTINELIDLAPLHNPANLTGIVAAKEILPNAKQVAIFDTAFHQTMPDHIYRYAVPSAWYRELGVRKYGFHGTSHLYVSKRVAALLGKPASKCNIISLHIGSGASTCAIKHGNSIDTSLGMTPLAGLIMGTRCGDLDPAVPFYVKEKLGLSDNLIMEILNKKSGILGITECYADRRDIEEHINDNKACKLAFDMETARMKNFIGSHIATIGEPIDAIVFTAGIGENGFLWRESVCKDMEHLGIKLNKEINDKTASFMNSGETEISTPDSKIKVFMIPTNEELVLVEDTLAILNGTYNPDHLNMDYSFIK